MTTPTQQTDIAEEAARSLSNLNVFYAVIGLLENGTIRGEAASESASQIIEICKLASSDELFDYDQSIAAIRTHQGKQHG